MFSQFSFRQFHRSSARPTPLAAVLLFVVLAAASRKATGGIIIVDPVFCPEADGQVTLGAPVLITDFGGEMSGIATGDLNSDGDKDFVAASTGSNTIRIRFGTGDGGFSGGYNYTMGETPTDVAIADFNNDGYKDIIAPDADQDRVRIRWGAASKPWWSYSHVATGDNPWRVATGDFNKDNLDDFVTVNLLTNNLTVALRKPAGGFDTTTYSSGDSNDIELADMNKDGYLDLVYPSGVHNSVVNYRLNDKSGGFGGPNPIDMGSGHAENFASIAVGHLDGNGRLDILGSRNDHTLVRVLGTGAGTFGSPVEAPANNNPFQIYMRDIDRDGNLDFALTHFLVGDDNVSIYLGDGAGNAVGPFHYDVPGRAYDLALDDFNEDGLPDMVVSSGHGVYFLASDSPCFDPEPENAPFRRGDMNADGGRDIADAVFGLNWLFGGTEADEPTCIDAVDANDDGQVDVADPVALLNYLFSDGEAPPAPATIFCGFDPTRDELTCESFDACLVIEIIDVIDDDPDPRDPGNPGDFKF